MQEAWYGIPMRVSGKMWVNYAELAYVFTIKDLRSIDGPNWFCLRQQICNCIPDIDSLGVQRETFCQMRCWIDVICAGLMRITLNNVRVTLMCGIEHVISNFSAERDHCSIFKLHRYVFVDVWWNTVWCMTFVKQIAKYLIQLIGFVSLN